MLFDKITLEPDERVLTTVRKHWFVISIDILVIILFGLLPVVLLLATSQLPNIFGLTALIFSHPPVLVFFMAFWLFLSTIAATTAWTHHFLDLWVITDRRVIVIEQIHFFNRRVSNFRLERLQDIKVSVNGFIPTMLNFGTLRAQTASATESNFESSGLPAPRELQSLMQNAMDDQLPLEA
jgi:hypothetical protein